MECGTGTHCHPADSGSMLAMKEGRSDCEGRSQPPSSKGMLAFVLGLVPLALRHCMRHNEACVFEQGVCGWMGLERRTWSGGGGRVSRVLMMVESETGLMDGGCVRAWEGACAWGCVS